MLGDLQLAEFIYEQPAIGDIEYIFKHALTQEVAYNSVLIERRKLLHERAAQAIEALFADRLEDHLAELAHHYDRSGNVRQGGRIPEARRPPGGTADGAFRGCGLFESGTGCCSKTCPTARSAAGMNLTWKWL